MAKYLRGTCEHYCPEHERKLRIKEKLLNYYEFENGNADIPGILIKEFTRSAAGSKAPIAKDLRTAECLQRTVTYLLKEIVLDKRKTYKHVYAFIFNRLRSVRQDIVIQGFDLQIIIQLLQPIIMFLAYSRYRLCTESIEDFDPKICDQHLQECLKRVLTCYDDMHKGSMCTSTLQAEINRNYIEAIYQLFNLGSMGALERCIELPLEIRNSLVYQPVFEIAMDFHRGNFYRVLKGIQKLPHILCAIASLKIPLIKRKLLEMFSHGYNSKQLMVPVEFIYTLMRYGDMSTLIADCKHYNLKLSEDQKQIHFSKTNFNTNATLITCRHEDFVENKLKKCYLPDILLMRKL